MKYKIEWINKENCSVDIEAKNIEEARSMFLNGDLNGSETIHTREAININIEEVEEWKKHII